MGIVINHIKNTLSEVFDTFFSSDMGVISDDAKNILSDKENQKAYLDGLEQLRIQEKKKVPNPTVEIPLKDNKTMILTR